jgi:hypothetical protein
VMTRMRFRQQAREEEHDEHFDDHQLDFNIPELPNTNTFDGDNEQLFGSLSPGSGAFSPPVGDGASTILESSATEDQRGHV